jgi:hypothetical protein
MAGKFGIPPDKLELMPDLWSAVARTRAVLRHETPTESRVAARFASARQASILTGHPVR